MQTYIHTVQIVQINTTLKVLDLRDNAIGNEGATALSTGLEQNHSITILYLNGNEIGKEGGQALGKALEINSSLNVLHLQNNMIGIGAVQIASSLEQNETLSVLQLGSNDIPSEVVDQFAQSLPLNQTLSALGLLSNPRINASSAAALRKVVRQRESGFDREMTSSKTYHGLQSDTSETKAGGGNVLMLWLSDADARNLHSRYGNKKNGGTRYSKK